MAGIRRCFPGVPKARHLMKGSAYLMCLTVFALKVYCADLPVGKIVWWGQNVIPGAYSEPTNGVIEFHDKTLDNVVAIAARHVQGLGLKIDTTVAAFGRIMYEGNSVPAGLSNVVSIGVHGHSYWAIKRNGTVVRWGMDGDKQNIVAGLSNITAISWATYRSYLALKKDGSVLGFRLDDPKSPIVPVPRPAIRLVKVHGQLLSNVVALACVGFNPIVLKGDGAVFTLGFQKAGSSPIQPTYTKIDDSTVEIDPGGESWKTPYEYTSADPVMIRGNALSNVVAITSGTEFGLALKRDGRVVAWGQDSYGETAVPKGLNNVTAISADGSLCLALKSDGTVVAWGDNGIGQTSVPIGLSNVVAIAAGGTTSLALTTGIVPPSVLTTHKN
jgi:alpha-tubulin suppressor-like RCC1 family protein